MDYNVELPDNVNLFSPKLLSVRVFYHSNRNKARMVGLAKMGVINVLLRQSFL